MPKRALAVLACGVLGACNPDTVVHRVSWFSDMHYQRSIKPYEQPIPPPEGAIPITGGEPLVDAENADRLRNPRATTAESLERGRWVYGTYCLVCHGAEGRGDGPVSAPAGGPFPGIPSLVDDARRRLSDGNIYGVTVNAQAMGRGMMPLYGYRIRGSDRWDVVNYVRLLQGSAAGAGGRP